MHDVHMAISGESVCDEVHPCRVMIYSNSRVRGYGLLGDICCSEITSMATHKIVKISVSVVDGNSVWRRNDSTMVY